MYIHVLIKNIFHVVLKVLSANDLPLTVYHGPYAPPVSRAAHSHSPPRESTVVYRPGQKLSALNEID